MDPSGQKATAVTGSECAAIERTQTPLRTSQSRIVSSYAHDANRAPDWLKAQAYVKLVCPCSTRSVFALASDQTRTDLSSLVDARVAESCIQHTEFTPAVWPRRSVCNELCGGLSGSIAHIPIVWSEACGVSENASAGSSYMTWPGTGHRERMLRQ